MHIQTNFYFNMLGYKIHDVAYLSKNLNTVWEEYIEQVRYFLKNIMDSERRQEGT